VRRRRHSGGKSSSFELQELRFFRLLVAIFRANRPGMRPASLRSKEKWMSTQTQKLDEATGFAETHAVLLVLGIESVLLLAAGIFWGI
jgi:hypothetical protein